jgi:hypothetical protein
MKRGGAARPALFWLLAPGSWLLTPEVMYRKPKFLEDLHAIREEMSRECDYDIDLFSEMVRSGQRPSYRPSRNGRGLRQGGAKPPPGDKKSYSGRSNE